MKIFLVLTILLLITSSIYAADWDLDKGSKEVGGYFSFRYFSGDLYEDGGIKYLGSSVSTRNYRWDLTQT